MPSLQKNIIVIGSSNTDMVVKTTGLPKPGETVIGETFFMNAGGKGANQAVAAARLGGHVSLIAKTGNDIFGKQSIKLFKEEGIDTVAVMVDDKEPSGVALITVDDNGENCIVVAPGANAALSSIDIQKFQSMIESADIILLQLEIPLETVNYSTSIAATQKNIITILNPAPACKLQDGLLQRISVITPNETEAALLTGIKVESIEDAKNAAMILHKKGINTVILTMGAKGALLLHENKFTLIESPKVTAVDTTAAGDIFNGALAVALSEDKSMEEAVSFACRAAALSVTKLGAQASAPYRNEI